MASIKCTPRTNQQTRNILFGDIGAGVIFRLKGEKNALYIRTNAIYEGAEVSNAVNLSTGDTDFFDKDETIEIIHCISYSENDIESTMPRYD